MVDGREPFDQRLAAATADRETHLCVGVDPVGSAIPSGLGDGTAGIRRFCLELIEATAPAAAAFKPNSAFFEALGDDGWRLLREVVGEATRLAPVIVDVKRGDIGSTAEAYAAAIFDYLGADACTLQPYLGEDSLRPYLKRSGRGAFVLCRTSNPGAADLQDLQLQDTGEPLYMHVARSAARWGGAYPEFTLGLVVGATWPEEMVRVRAAVPEMPLLIPGVGAQGGDLAATIRAASSVPDAAPFLINVSRGITQVPTGAEFASGARRAADRWRNEMRAIAAG